MMTIINESIYKLPYLIFFVSLTNGKKKVVIYWYNSKHGIYNLTGCIDDFFQLQITELSRPIS